MVFLPAFFENLRTSLDILEIDEPWLEAALRSPNYAPDGLPIIDLPYLILMKLNASRSQDLAECLAVQPIHKFNK